MEPPFRVQAHAVRSMIPRLHVGIEPRKLTFVHGSTGFRIHIKHPHHAVLVLRGKNAPPICRRQHPVDPLHLRPRARRFTRHMIGTDAINPALPRSRVVDHSLPIDGHVIHPALSPCHRVNRKHFGSRDSRRPSAQTLRLRLAHQQLTLRRPCQPVGPSGLLPHGGHLPRRQRQPVNARVLQVGEVEVIPTVPSRSLTAAHAREESLGRLPDWFVRGHQPDTNRAQRKQHPWRFHPDIQSRMRSTSNTDSTTVRCPSRRTCPVPSPSTTRRSKTGSLATREILMRARRAPAGLCHRR